MDRSADIKVAACRGDDGTGTVSIAFIGNIGNRRCLAPMGDLRLDAVATAGRVAAVAWPTHQGRITGIR
jgi:hypothetical protein